MHPQRVGKNNEKKKHGTRESKQKSSQLNAHFSQNGGGEGGFVEQ